MKTRINEKIGEEVMENILNQNYPVADTFAVSIKSGQGLLQRGSLLARISGEGDNEGLMVMHGTDAEDGEVLTANCVLAEYIDTGSESGNVITGLAYRSGHFNANKLLVKDGCTISAADKESLRMVGILLSDAAEI